jgi:hypothetical protein
MKKVFVIALFFVANAAMTSCTTDDITEKTTKEVKANDPGDGKTGPIPTTPPKP